MTKKTYGELAKEKQANENRRMIDEYFHDSDEDGPIIFSEELDGAIIGVGQQFTNDGLVAYSMTKIIECLTDQGMSHEEALEHFGFNIQGSWLGEGTPIIVDDYHFCCEGNENE